MNRPGICFDRRMEVLLLLLAGTALGACREFAFINLNYQIDHVGNHTRFSYAHSLVQGWTHGVDLRTLVILKWVLALGFMGLMALLCILLARVLFGSWRSVKPIVLGFLGFALFAFLLHLLSRWAAPFELVSVRISHMLQYPVPMLFLLIAATIPRGRGVENAEG